jgi:hypothetical protein
MTTAPAASIGFAAAEAGGTASAVSTATMSRPSMATDPRESTRRFPVDVITVPLGRRQEPCGGRRLAHPADAPPQQHCAHRMRFYTTFGKYEYVGCPRRRAPLVHDALVTLRERERRRNFPADGGGISLLLRADATRDLPASPVTVQTPLGAAEGAVRPTVVVFPCCARAGMLDAILELIPARASATSACSATRAPRSRRSTTRSSRRAGSSVV